MAKLVYGLNQSLDGYVDHEVFAPGHLLFHHFIEQTRGLAGSGRRPPLRLVANDLIGEDAIRLTYVPA